MKTSESKSQATRETVASSSPSRVEAPAVESGRDSASVLHLQRVVGNQAVTRLMAGPNIRVGAPDHPLEREARCTANALAINHQPQTTQSSTDGGRPLTDRQMAFFYPHFSTDLSRVRLHTGPSANAAARALGARAFTVGSDIGFATPSIEPNTLAHELAHAAQPQTGASALWRDADDENEIQMPAEFVGRTWDGRRDHVKDKDIYAGVNKSRAEDKATEDKADALRKRRIDIKRTGSKMQRWTVEFEQDPRVIKDAGSVAGARDDGEMTASGVRVPTHAGDYLSPRRFYERRDAAMLAYQGYIHYAELVEAGAAQAALYLAMQTNGGNPIRDDVLNLGAYARWAARAEDARDKALLLAMMTAGGGASSGAGGAELTAMQRAESTLANTIGGAFVKPSVVGAQVSVEGVAIGGIRASAQNGELLVSYNHIFNTSRVANQGKLIHSAFEAGAIRAARAGGFKSARVAVATIINQNWYAYLESLGYSRALITITPETSSVVLTKVFPL